MQPQRMTLNEAAAALGIAPNSVRTRFKSGKIKGERDNAGKIWVWLSPDTPANMRPSKKLRQKVTVEAKNNDLEPIIEMLTEEVRTLRPKAAEAERLAGELSGLRVALDEVRADRDHWRTEAGRGFFSRLLGR